MGDSWVTFGLFQERLCDVSVVLVVSVVLIWRWIRSAECQLSESGAAVIGAGYEVLSANRVSLEPQLLALDTKCCVPSQVVGVCCRRRPTPYLVRFLV